ncbi:hypothetical protein Tco_0236769 [Tanacetum coccineum]
MKDIPIIVLSDDDSDAPVAIKCRRLVKNGAIVKKNYVQGGQNQNLSNETTYQRMKKVPLIVISDDDDDELKKELPMKKSYGKEVPKIKNVKTNNESPIGFNTNKKKDQCMVSKSLTKNLIDEPTDEEFSDLNTYKNNKRFSLDDFVDATAEDLYDSDMYSVRSVSDGYRKTAS